MKISVITVCKNAGETIENTIKSILSQTYENIEYIIIDGISTDNTLDIIKKYQDKIHCWLSEQDSGLYNAMNKGIKASSGEILFFLNADDTIYNEKVIERIINYFERSKADIIYGDLIAVNRETNTEELQKSNSADKLFWMNQCVCHQVIFYKKELFQKYGYYDEKYKIAADYDFNLKCIIKNKTKAIYVSEIISKFTIGGFGHQNKEIYNKEQQEIINKFFSKTQLKIKNFLFKQCRSIIKNKMLRGFLDKLIF
jgi:glycosyltransferase involved in cell wall biosynthesis